MGRFNVVKLALLDLFLPTKYLTLLQVLYTFSSYRSNEVESKVVLGI